MTFLSNHWFTMAVWMLGFVAGLLWAIRKEIRRKGPNDLVIDIPPPPSSDKRNEQLAGVELTLVRGKK